MCGQANSCGPTLPAQLRAGHVAPSTPALTRMSKRLLIRSAHQVIRSRHEAAHNLLVSIQLQRPQVGPGRRRRHSCTFGASGCSRLAGSLPPRGVHALTACRLSHCRFCSKSMGETPLVVGVRRSHLARPPAVSCPPARPPAPCTLSAPPNPSQPYRFIAVWPMPHLATPRRLPHAQQELRAARRPCAQPAQPRQASRLALGPGIPLKRICRCTCWATAAALSAQGPHLVRKAVLGRMCVGEG